MQLVLSLKGPRPWTASVFFLSHGPTATMSSTFLLGSQIGLGAGIKNQFNGSRIMNILQRGHVSVTGLERILPHAVTF